MKEERKKRIKTIKMKDLKDASLKKYDSVLKINTDIIDTGLFGCQNTIQVECSINFARYLKECGITVKNYLLFLKLVETNNKWIVDELLDNREPNLLFTRIPVDPFLIEKAFTILSYWHPNQIYHKVLESLLGILESAYYDSDDGYNLYNLQIADINTVGKYLEKEKGQDFTTNRIILDILHKISQLGRYDNEIKKSIIAKHAFNIRFAFFDDRKDLKDIIPQLLLIKVKHEEMSPSEKFKTFLNRKNNKE